MSIEWLIIGGGIHGVHLAARLIGEAGVAPDQLRIVDPADRLLARWHACTEMTGMTHLRSPSVHHLDLDPWSLKRFAGRRGRRKPELFAAPYGRPALALFNAHCDSVVSRFELAELHISRAPARVPRADHSGVKLQGRSGMSVCRRRVCSSSHTPIEHWSSFAPRSAWVRAGDHSLARLSSTPQG
jgi:hypothetical protein